MCSFSFADFLAAAEEARRAEAIRKQELDLRERLLRQIEAEIEQEQPLHKDDAHSCFIVEAKKEGFDDGAARLAQLDVPPILQIPILQMVSPPVESLMSPVLPVESSTLPLKSPVLPVESSTLPLESLALVESSTEIPPTPEVLPPLRHQPRRQTSQVQFV